jgi:homoserine dehydrogenase
MSPVSLNVAVVGIGLVGCEFLSQLAAYASRSNQQQHRPIRLIYISSSTRAVSSAVASGLSLTSWESELAASSQKPDLSTLPQHLLSLGATDNDKGKNSRTVLVDNTSSDEVAALYPSFLRSGVNIVTPNKKAFSSSLKLYKEILQAAEEGDTKFRGESTVGAGLPVVQTLNDLVDTGDKITKIEGVFSGTFSYIFNEFSTVSGNGPTFSSVVSVAKANGYTEPHPGDDLSGADVARKLTILSRLIPSLRSALPEGYKSVSTKSLTPPPLELVTSGEEYVQKLPAFDGEFEDLRKSATSEGKVLRYVGVIDVKEGAIKASLERYPATHPFATSLAGSDNIIAFHTERYGARPLIVQGAGAGAAVTAMGVLSDLIKI